MRFTAWGLENERRMLLASGTMSDDHPPAQGIDFSTPLTITYDKLQMFTNT